jgi:uncharacterized protein (TIGR03437 family)
MAPKVISFICAITALACAAPPASFQTHYIPLGGQDVSVAIATDAAGNIFVVSKTVDSPGAVGIRATKTDPQGNLLATLAFAPGVTPSGAAVGAGGSLLVVGSSYTGAYIGGEQAASVLVAKLDNALTTVESTATIGNGATGVTYATAVAVDGAGDVYVAGGSSAVDFPATPGSYEPNPPHSDPSNPGAIPMYAFVAELAPDLSSILHATFYGSSLVDCNQISVYCRGTYFRVTATTVAAAIAVGPSGSVVIAGVSNGGPASPLVLFPYNYGFVAELSADLGSFKGQTQFGPNPLVSYSEAYVSAIAFDRQGNLVVAGGAGSGLVLPANALQPKFNSFDFAGFVAKLNPSLAPVWGTYIGGAFPVTEGTAAGVVADSDGNVWVTGVSQASEPPNSSSTSVATLPYVAELAPDGSSILNLAVSQFGGAALASTPDGGVAVLGAADSFLLTVPPDQPSLLMVASSANNMSSGTIAPAELISLYGAGIGPASPLPGQIVDGAFTSNLGGCQVLFNGIAAPILYASPNQVNVVVPAAIAGQQSAAIEVAGPQGSTVFPTVFVSAARPQVFSPPSFYGETYAVAFNQNGSVNSMSNPASGGSTVTIWVTGTGLLANGQPPDGTISEAGSPTSLPVSVLAWTGVNVQESLNVTYAGQAPGAVLGLTQINVQVVPASSDLGGYPALSLFLDVGGSVSGYFDIVVR